MKIFAMNFPSWLVMFVAVVDVVVVGRNRNETFGKEAGGRIGSDWQNILPYVYLFSFRSLGVVFD